MIWLFDQARAKGDHGEGLRAPEEVRRYCRELISVVGRGGGFIPSTGAAVDQAEPENLRSMMAAVGL